MHVIYLFTGLHPLFESLITDPPEGFRVISNVSASNFKINKEYSRVNSLIKNILTRIYNILNIPRLVYIPKKCDLIHTCGGIIPLNNVPWVVSIETSSSFVSYQEEKMFNINMRSKIARYLLDKNCKKILPLSMACETAFFNIFKEIRDKIKDKVEVLYPAIKPYKVRQKKENDRIRLLFIGNQFFDKGGRELIKALEALSKRYDVELFMITGVPKHHQAYFRQFIMKYSGYDNLHIITRNVDRETLFSRYYSTSDIFVLPSYIDTFGYVFLEAMSVGLPLIGTDVFAIPEIIENGVNGFLIHSPLSPFDKNFLRTPESLKTYRQRIIAGDVPEVTTQLIEKISILIEDDNLRKKMGRESYKMVESGKFSIKERNKKLKRIYEEALRW